MQVREPATPTFAHPADRQQIQGIQDDMSECLGIALVITDTVGHFITQPSGHRPTCLVTSQPAQSCIVVQKAAEAGLIERDVKALYVSSAGISHILVPIRMGNFLLGVMVAAQPQETPLGRARGIADFDLRLISPEEASFGSLSRQQLVAIGSLLNSVASRLVELDMKHRLADQRMREISAINEASAAITSTLDLRALPDIVVKKAAELVSAESAFLAMPDERTGDLRLAAATGLPETIKQQMRVRVGEGPIGKAAQTGGSILRNDVLLHTSIRELNGSQRPQLASVICVPLKAKSELVGVLGVASSTHHFEPENLEVLQSLVNQATFAILNARLYDEAQQALQKLNRLFALGAEINSVQSLGEVLKEVNRHALGATQGMACNITLIDNDGRVKVRAAVGFSPRINRQIVVRPNGLSMRVKQSGQPLAIPDTLSAADIVNPVMIQAGVRSSLCLPLRVKDKVIGVIWMHYAQPRSFLQADINLLLAFANQSAVAIDNAQLREELVEQATRDGKTKLFNHDFFLARLRIELERARRTESPLSLIMIDIDHFKEYNDTFGHLAGDEALRVVADLIVSKTRKSDVVARYGGEEFAVLLPNANAEHALSVAERIRTSIQAASQKIGPSVGPPRLTVSLGVASYPRFASTENELIDRADKALYQAKALGKNRASIFSP